VLKPTRKARPNELSVTNSACDSLDADGVQNHTTMMPAKPPSSTRNVMRIHDSSGVAGSRMRRRWNTTAPSMPYSAGSTHRPTKAMPLRSLNRFEK